MPPFQGVINLISLVIKKVFIIDNYRKEDNVIYVFVWLTFQNDSDHIFTGKINTCSSFYSVNYFI